MSGFFQLLPLRWNTDFVCLQQQPLTHRDSHCIWSSFLFCFCFLQCAKRFTGFDLEKGDVICNGFFFPASVFLSPSLPLSRSDSLPSTLKNKELSPVIGQKGIQGTMSSGGQSPHSEHSPHTLRRGISEGSVWMCRKINGCCTFQSIRCADEFCIKSYFQGTETLNERQMSIFNWIWIE